MTIPLDVEGMQKALAERAETYSDGVAPLDPQETRTMDRTADGQTTPKSPRFEVGDTVVLLSGSPTMTVTAVRREPAPSPGYWCSWFYDGEQRNAIFPEAALMPTWWVKGEDGPGGWRCLAADKLRRPACVPPDTPESDPEPDDPAADAD